MRASLLILFLYCFTDTLQAQNVIFADPNFKTALVNDVFVNLNGDNEIQLAEAIACTDIYVPNANISNAGGLENFVNLIYFDMSGNNLSTVDLSIAPSLQEIRCFNNNLTSLTLPTSNTALRVLDVNNNALSSIVLPTSLANLDTLKVFRNQLSSLSLPTNITDLVYIDASNNQLASLDVSSGTALKDVLCDNNVLTSLTIPTLASPPSGRLNKLSCRNNSFTSLRIAEPVTLLDCGGNSLMDSLWVKGTIFGEEVRCDNSQLVYIGLSNEIEILDCSNNQLEELLISQQSKLATLNCSGNDLDTLFLSHPPLTTLDCSNNQLEVVRIFNSAGSNLVNFDSRNNPLLFCVESSDLANAQANWTNKDPQTVIRSLGACTGIWSTTTALSNLPNVNLYPNPTTKNVQIDLGQWYEDIHVQVYNNLGQLVQQKSPSSTAQFTVALPQDRGIYLLKVQTEKGIKVFQVIKQ